MRQPIKPAARAGLATLCTFALLLGGCSPTTAASSSSLPAENTTTVTGRVTKVSGNDLELALGSYSSGQGGGSGNHASGTEAPPDGSGDLPQPASVASRPAGGGSGGDRKQKPDDSASASTSAPTDNAASAADRSTAASPDPAETQSESTAAPPTNDQAPPADLPSGSMPEPPSGDGAPPAGADAPQQQDGASPDGERGGGGGQKQQGRFTESGETLSVRIPVGTPIQYGTLEVDFSQIQLDFVISLMLAEDGTTVLSAEILST